tara:strand:+ start:8735 stop:9130 length:396 start_codon:yes stop_codon:yes gene_type:complete
MNERRDIKSQDRREVQEQAGQQSYLRPAVDIYENSGGITVEADLPGVSRERLSIEVDGNNLTIDGEIGVEMPDGMEALHAEIGSRRFRRSFTLSNELQADKISAELKDGVVLLKLPKREELKPRKIEVTMG